MASAHAARPVVSVTRGGRLRAALLTWWRRGAPPTLLAELAGSPAGLAGFLFEQPGIGLVALDRSGAIVRANAAMHVLVGGRVHLAVGAAATGLFAESEREAATAEIASCLRGQAVRPVFGAILRGGASVGVAALALREKDGLVCGALLRVVDLSAQRELEIQLGQAQKVQAVGQLAGGIAHDFNNLLTAVLGAAESVAGRADLPAEAADDVAQIRASAGRGAALVRQLLAFGRQQTLQPRVLSVNEVASDLAGLLRRLLGSQIRLDLDLAEPGGQVRADPTQLDQVLVNLAVNARDAMPEGGTLVLRTGQITLHRAQSRGAEEMPPGRYVTVEVQDSGIGIAPDVLPRIFDPFFTTRREQGGTGLGLSTVHGIIRQSEGFLDVDSTPGVGTRLRIFLPRADDRALSIPVPPDAPGSSVAVPATASPWGTVLVVDDEEPVRRLAERALTRAGWTVLGASGGEAALAVLEAHRGPALVGLVTDMAMHGMDGVQVLRAVRARLGLHGLPALLVSGYAEASLRVALAGEDRVAFLAKPYALRELVDAFAALVATAADGPMQVGAQKTVAIPQATNIG